MQSKSNSHCTVCNQNASHSNYRCRDLLLAELHTHRLHSTRKIISNHFSFSNANGFIIITNGKKIYNYYFACRTKARKILCSAFHSLIPTRFDHSQSGRLQVFLYPMGYSVSPSFFFNENRYFYLNEPFSMLCHILSMSGFIFWLFFSHLKCTSFVRSFCSGKFN